MASGRRARSADHTHSLVLDHIRASARISRVELAEKTGLTAATISNVVRRFLADGLVVEVGQSESTGGKPRTLLEIDSAARYGVGVSLARDVITVVVADLAGNRVGGREVAGAGDTDPAAVIAGLNTEIAELLAGLDVRDEAVVGIGVAGPGPLDTATGMLRGRQPSPSWDGFALEERLEELTGKRVVLDNDATCAALGEHWTDRRGVTPSVAATVFMADGIGCGILIDGRVLHGSSSNAGELGHIILEQDGPVCHCGSRGCVEMYASPEAVVGNALKNVHLVAELGLDPGVRAGRENFAIVTNAAVAGHPGAIALLEDAASYLGRGIVILSNILDLSELNLCGPGFAEAGPIYQRVAQTMLDQGTFMRRIHPVTVRLSRIGADAAALGAAALILQEEMTPHSAGAARRGRTTLHI